METAAAAIWRERIGRGLRRARAGAGMSQSGLSAAAGLDQSSLSRYEQGLREPTLDVALRIAEAVGVPPADLVGELLGEPPPGLISGMLGNPPAKPGGGGSVGELLRRARDAGGKSQLELASLVGIGQATLSHYERGDRVPPLGVLANLAAALDCSAADPA